MFVHGWSCDRFDWDGQLALPWRIVRLDFAGHGESGRGRSDWTIASFGEDVVAVVRALDLRRIVLVGHSMGGDIALAAAARLPGRVAGIVWVDVYDALGPGSGRTPAEVEERMAPFRASFAESVRGFVRGMFAPSADPELVSRIVARMAGASPEIALACMRAAWNAHPAVPSALRALDLPVVSINPVDGPCDEENLRAHGVSVVRMGGVRHFPHLEDPVAFNRVLREIVLKLCPPEDVD